jgi:nucleotide-binding universal stress UspA family protein
MKRRTKFLVCVDNTAHSRTAVRFACAKAKSLGCPIELIHVLNPSEYNSIFGVGEKMKAERWAEAENLMNKMASEAFDFAGLMPSFMIREGVLSEEIIKAIRDDQDYNMLIIGKAAHEAGKKEIISMLTSELASKIMIPMMVVPGNLTDTQIQELV